MTESKNARSSVISSIACGSVTSTFSISEIKSRSAYAPDTVMPVAVYSISYASPPMSAGMVSACAGTPSDMVSKIMPSTMLDISVAPGTLSCVDTPFLFDTIGISQAGVKKSMQIINHEKVKVFYSTYAGAKAHHHATTPPGHHITPRSICMIFSPITLAARDCASLVCAPMCGVSITLSSSASLVLVAGSDSNTSSAAPPSVPHARA